MLEFKATSISIQETVLVFENNDKNGNKIHEEVIFHTAKLKPIIRGVEQGSTPDPAVYIYAPVNFLLALFPVETQWAIFEIYRDIEAEITDPVMGFGIDKNIRAINVMVKKLFDILTIDMLTLSIQRDYSIYIPELTNDQYSRSVVSKPYSGLGLESEDFDGVEDSAKYSEYKTEDYRGLIILSLAARLLIPIFGTMMEYIDGTVSSKFITFIVFKCIYGSWLQECSVMEKYRYYLAYQAGQNTRNKFSATMDGLSEDQLPEYMAADTFVKKMGVFDLYKTDPNHNLIKAVYNYATNTILGSLDKKFSGSIRGKTPPKEKTTMSGDEDKSGVLSDNITKTSISVGERVVEDHLVDWITAEKSLAVILERDVTKDEMRIYREIRSLISKYEPDGLTGNFRDSITANLCDSVSDASMHYCLESSAAYKMQSLAITKLIIYGHYDIAALCMATVDEATTSWGVSKPSILTKDNRDIIYNLYRVWYPDSSANKNNSFFNNYISVLGPSVLNDQRYNNPGSRQIATWVTKYLTSNFYKTVLPERYLLQCNGYVENDNYNYQRPNNINNILAMLVIQIASENQNTN